LCLMLILSESRAIVADKLEASCDRSREAGPLSINVSIPLCSSSIDRR